jgi:regulator of protease activity HflC (stomatin/prohibitin superfamily)
MRLCVIIIFCISLLIIIASIIITNTSKYPYFAIGIGVGAIGVFFTMMLQCYCNGGFITIAPNEAIVFQYYGRYLGTVKDNGFFFGYLMAKIFRMSLRSNQYNGNRLKVNERDGNPVELGIVVVWKIEDTANAIFDVEN